MCKFDMLKTRTLSVVVARGCERWEMGEDGFNFMSVFDVMEGVSTNFVCMMFIITSNHMALLFTMSYFEKL